MRLPKYWFDSQVMITLLIAIGLVMWGLGKQDGVQIKKPGVDYADTSVSPAFVTLNVMTDGAFTQLITDLEALSQ